MSLVGTRPPTVDEWDKYELHHRARLATKPGLTGMWQVSGRSNITDLSILPDREKYIFLICGRAVVNSTLDKQLKQMAKKMGVRIELLGHRSDIPQINACADIAVLPSLREGLGMAGLEALATGIPVIGSDVQGIREYVIDGETGYLCNPIDEKEFAK